jgi:pSer/pThr/pTyr-binding forkhead associated (FHA) protein
MKISLVVLNAGKASGQVIPVNLAQFTIGRDPECNLRPASALISKRHCALLVRQEEVFLRDFDSTNGTFVNEAPVKGEVPIKNEDMLRVGPLQFKVAIEASNLTAKASRTKPTPTPEKKQSAALKATKKTSDDDDDVAAMLLSLPGELSADDSTAKGDEVPSGSTVMDLVVPKSDAAAAPETPTQTPAAPADTAPDAEKKPGTPQPAAKEKDKKVDTAHSAAKAILDKYARRGRG